MIIPLNFLFYLTMLETASFLDQTCIENFSQDKEFMLTFCYNGQVGDGADPLVFIIHYKIKNNSLGNLSFPLVAIDF